MIMIANKGHGSRRWLLMPVIVWIAGACTKASTDDMHPSGASSSPESMAAARPADAHSAIAVPDIWDSKGRLRFIGDYLLFPVEMEAAALETGGYFKQETGLSLSQLNYDVDNPLPLAFDKSAGTFSELVPEGSLLIIRHQDEEGAFVTTCALLADDEVIFYSYPPGFRGALSGAQHTGYSGSLSLFLSA